MFQCSCRYRSFAVADIHILEQLSLFSSVYIIVTYVTIGMDKFVVKTKRKCEDTRLSTGKRRKSNEAHTERDDQSENNQVETKIDIVFRTLKGENLNCEYCRFLSRSDADNLLKECESTLSYNTGDLAKVHIYGKWLDIPRQQVRRRLTLCTRLDKMKCIHH